MHVIIVLVYIKFGNGRQNLYHGYGIMFGKSECNANWQTYSLVKSIILSVDYLTNIHNTHDYK